MKHVLDSTDDLLPALILRIEVSSPVCELDLNDTRCISINQNAIIPSGRSFKQIKKDVNSILRSIGFYPLCDDIRNIPVRDYVLSMFEGAIVVIGKQLTVPVDGKGNNYLFEQPLLRVVVSLEPYVVNTSVREVVGFGFREPVDKKLVKKIVNTIAGSKIVGT